MAVCPKTKANIIETETHYTVEDSSSDCKIHIERCISKRDLTRDEAKTLIETGSVGPFDDFVSKKTRTLQCIVVPEKEPVGWLQICKTFVNTTVSEGRLKHIPLKGFSWTVGTTMLSSLVPGLLAGEQQRSSATMD